jgi:3-oxoacyl-[acyl-carrier protein] reductase
MDLQLSGKRAIVLGATRGIGRAIAETLLDEGVRLAFCARGEKAVLEAKRALARDGAEPFAEAVDIADEAGLRAFIGRAIKNLGGLDIAVSNASAGAPGPSRQSFHAMVDVDIQGLVNLVEAGGEALKESAAQNGDAALLAIGSVSHVDAGGPDAYGAIKGALVHLVKGYARQLAPAKVRCNMISPGTTYFPGGYWQGVEVKKPDVFAHVIKMNPLGRMGTPQEIGATAAFLASPRSGFTTGANFVVDGGITERANY